MPSPMEGSSREGDLFTVKHELKNGKLAASFTFKAVNLSFDIYIIYFRSNVSGEMLKT